MLILQAFRVIVMTMFLAKTIWCFPDVQYCQQTPSQGGQNVSNSTSFTIEGQLPNRFGDSITCQIRDDRNASFLFINASKESTGSFQVTVFNSMMARMIGSLEVSRNEESDSFLMCLDRTTELDNGTKYVVISGTPKVNFTVQINFITRNKLVVGAKGEIFHGSNIFMFLPDKHKDAQLDITVQSDTDTPAILTVSHYCTQTEKRQITDHSKPSISLTFSKKGRITLSKVSRPSFNTSSKKPYYISVLPPKATENFDEFRKPFLIKLEISFDYNYLIPICFIVFVSFFGGVIVAFWALKCFKEPLILVSSSPSSLESTSGYDGASVKFEGGNVKFWSCCRDAENNDELQRLLPQKEQELIQSTYKELFRAMFAVLRYHWIGKGRKSFSYITCIVGFVLLVGAFQFVYVNWEVMVDDGDRDKCFYNDWCYRVSPYSDIPFNLMISNLSYMIHGMILAWSMWVMEAELYIQARRKAKLEYKKPQKEPENEEKLPRHTLVCSNLQVHLPELSVPPFNVNEDERILGIYTRAYKNKYSFCIGYAFAWALIFEGLFSLTYHLCPSRLTFQFDSAFMFVIAGLIVVSLFNGVSVKECQKESGNPRPIEDTSFFLFVIVPLYILNYLGSLYNKYGQGKDLPESVYVVFCIAMVLWYLLIFLWSLNKLFHSSYKNGFHTFESKVKLFFFVVMVIIACVIFPSLLHKDISHLFLFSCISAALASSLGKIVIKTYRAKGDYKSLRTIVLRVFQGLYIACAVAIMCVAIYVFQYIPTSDKTALAEVSRSQNKDCALLGFYGDHDIWHILSSFGLLIGAFLVMYISE